LLILVHSSNRLKLKYEFTPTFKNKLIYELDSEGNMIPIQPQPSPQSSILQEAQKAMASHLANNTEWATPDLLQTISNHPKLASGMNNPKFTAALQRMQSNPKETLEKLHNEEPEVVEFITEFCGVMGEHFCQLGEKQGAASVVTSNEKVREMGVLEEKAMRKHKAEINQHNMQESTNQSTNHESGADMDDQVSSILSNEELRSILMDTKMQQIMEECSTQSGKLQYYMRHEEFGPKLRRLMDAGLLRIA
jgi:hypothetical protein